MYFQRSVFGVKAIADGPLVSEGLREMEQMRIDDLELNDGNGWIGDSLRFLERFPWLESLTVISFALRSIAGLEAVPNLRQLTLFTYCKQSVNFAIFPHLTDCSFEWIEGSESLFECVRLRKLFVNRYSGRTLERLKALKSLTTLSWLNSPVTSLNGVEQMDALTDLRLGNLRRLVDISQISKLTQLRTCEIERCPRIGTLRDLEPLRDLRKLVLSDLGDIDSLAPLRSLSNLEMLVFDGSTNILDGDLSPILELKHLKSVAFRNRMHYSHRREQFKAYA